MTQGFELLPCPFCGQEARYKAFTVMLALDRHEVYCDNNRCVMFGAMNASSSKAEALKLWNTRTTPTLPEGAVEVGAKRLDELIQANAQFTCRQLAQACLEAAFPVLLREREEREWRAIETAPRNETDVLIYLPSRGVVQAWFAPLDSSFPSDIGVEGWWVASDGDMEYEAGLVTHWMPLPAPPADQTGSGDA